jgi:hypothetical protein
LSGQTEEARSETDTNQQGTSAPAVLPLIDVAPKPAEPKIFWKTPERRDRIDWRGLMGSSMRFIMVQHAFRLGTEQGTRDGMKGPFWAGYANSVGNMHGWSDGDQFYVNYIGHPIQGAVAGHIFANRDPQYWGVEFGRDPRYWKSRLRATAFSFAYSTQFEIGPISEASVGKIQSRYPQVGFVDQVVTPVFGLAWMMAEDALDKYVAQPLERRISNGYVRMLVRSWTSPARCFANAMDGRIPWARPDRPGVFQKSLQPFLDQKRHDKLLADARREKAKEQQGPEGFGVATFELTPTAKIIRTGGQTCYGGGAEGALRLTDSTQMLIDVHGCQLMQQPRNWHGDTLAYGAGPRWTPRATARWSPYAQFLLGGIKVTQIQEFPARKELLEAEAKRNGEPPPNREQYMTKYDLNGVSLAAAAGLDLRVHPAMAVRLANVELRKNWVSQINGFDYSSSVSMTMGVTLRLGTW